MADDDSPGNSPLSSLSSDADPFLQEESDHDGMAESLLPPAKRQKISDSSLSAMPASHLTDDDALSTISSDTEGDIPEAPNHLALLRVEDHDDVHEQVINCAWDSCNAGHLENMDKLVDHIHNEHIENGRKKYTCEWSDCNRKSMPHASGYALKAHMRSHTREKPFYCALPECDRAFTRSDALAKHMRTVHETEALRPSDPIPKGMFLRAPPPAHVSSAHPKFKIVVKPLQAVSNGTTNGSDLSTWTSSFSADLGFTPDEEARGSKELFRLLRRRLYWAQEEAESLKRQVEIMEVLRRKEWIEKEILLEQAITHDVSWHERRREVLAGLADLPTPQAIKAAAEHTRTFSPHGESGTSSSPPPTKNQDATDAATVLASLHQA